MPVASSHLSTVTMDKSVMSPVDNRFQVAVYSNLMEHLF